MQHSKGRKTLEQGCSFLEPLHYTASLHLRVPSAALTTRLTARTEVERRFGRYKGQE